MGIESTVARINAEKTASDEPGGASRTRVTITVFRRGGVSIPQLQAALAAAGYGDVEVAFKTLHTTKPDLFRSAAAGAQAHTPSPAAAALLAAAAAAVPSPAPTPIPPTLPAVEAPVEGGGAVVPPSAAAEEAGAVAPGMLMLHYAPYGLDTFLVTGLAGTGDGTPRVVHSTDGDAATRTLVDLRSTLVLDFGGTLAHLKPHVAAYRDLAPDGDVLVARSSLFDALRWCETIPDATVALVVDPMVAARGHEHVAAVRDRVLRAAAGKTVLVDAAAAPTRRTVTLIPTSDAPATSSHL